MQMALKAMATIFSLTKIFHACEFRTRLIYLNRTHTPMTSTPPLLPPQAYIMPHIRSQSKLLASFYHRYYYYYHYVLLLLPLLLELLLKLMLIPRRQWVTKWVSESSDFEVQPSRGPHQTATRCRQLEGWNDRRTDIYPTLAGFPSSTYFTMAY